MSRSRWLGDLYRGQDIQCHPSYFGIFINVFLSHRQRDIIKGSGVGYAEGYVSGLAGREAHYAR